MLASKQGNVITNGILYIVLGDLLSMPVKAINIPRQFILAFFKSTSMESDAENPWEYIHFYIDPLTGQLFTKNDVDNYFKRISVPANASYFKPIDNKRIIQVLLEEFSKCYHKEENLSQKNELLALAAMLGD